MRRALGVEPVEDGGRPVAASGYLLLEVGDALVGLGDAEVGFDAAVGEAVDREAVGEGVGFALDRVGVALGKIGVIVGAAELAVGRARAVGRRSPASSSAVRTGPTAVGPRRSATRTCTSTVACR